MEPHQSRILWLAKIEGRTLRSKLYVTKTPQKSLGLKVKFVVGSQWTTVVSRWAIRFHGGCVSVEDDPRSGSSKTSTYKRSEKLFKQK